PLQAVLRLTERAPAAVGHAAPERAVGPPLDPRDAALQAPAERIARALPAALHLLQRHPEHFGGGLVAAEHLIAVRAEATFGVPDEAGRRPAEQVVRDPDRGQAEVRDRARRGVEALPALHLARICDPARRQLARLDAPRMAVEVALVQRRELA